MENIQPAQPRILKRGTIIRKTDRTDVSTDIHTPPTDTRCMSRITHDHSAQHFGNGRNKFYLEFRCPLPRFRDMDVCVRCLVKHTKGQQDARTYDHGRMNEPIPHHSHIFGGEWYHTNKIKWGEPAPSVIEFALEHQIEARGSYPSKVDDPLQEEMARPKKEVTTSATSAASATSATTSATSESATSVPKRGRKAKPPQPKQEPKQEDDEKKEAVSVEPPKMKKRAPRKKAEPTPYQSLASEQRLIHKEVTLPTHMEQTMEEVDLEDYDVEYVTLTPIEIGQTTYYIDRSSQKVFKRIRDKQMGDYVGRYDPATETLHTDIPDSDDETDE